MPVIRVGFSCEFIPISILGGTVDLYSWVNRGVQSQNSRLALQVLISQYVAKL